MEIGKLAVARHGGYRAGDFSLIDKLLKQIRRLR